MKIMFPDIIEIKNIHKEEVKKYFDSNQREFNTPAEVKARHILVQYEGSRNAGGEAAKRKKDDAKKRAEEILAGKIDKLEQAEALAELARAAAQLKLLQKLRKIRG